ncbi:hypothetical protein PHMEG_00025108 [Phytophthora megakarya]|uniref:Uncharacterized protein n=1 Tax=Phytophthora megakarya TaxID=4795 RepID=A0A225VFC9_9STRA|nr:hypothetical protein PHMEG_00025108 [Phytophthora megakarya]
MSDEFKYQRIESEKWFNMGKAYRCHVISTDHYRNYKTYNNYDDDRSNRLVLSLTMLPALNISVESVSDSPLENRYKE